MRLSWSKLGWQLRRALRQVWARVTAFAALGLMTAVAGWLLKDTIPSGLTLKIGADSVGAILQILASSMLTVTTFSLSILTAAYASAGGNSTPRAVTLLVEDGTSQTVLATFIGAFVFSLVGIIMLETGLYGQGGRLILFAVTLLVVLIVVISLLRWIARLGRLGRVDDTLTRVETAAHAALAERLSEPWLGGNRLIGAPPVGARPVLSDRIGFIQHCDIARLSRIAEDHDLQIYLAANTGDFVHIAAPLLHVRPLPEDAKAQATLRDMLLASFTIESARSFEQDPRHGLRALSEIAQRALSPGINDPGTAELAITGMVRVLGQWDAPVEPAIQYPRIWVPALEVGDLMSIAFAPIARDGAGNLQVQTALQLALLALSQIAPQIFATDALAMSRLGLAYAESDIPIADHRASLQHLAGQIADLAQQSDGNCSDGKTDNMHNLAEKL